MIAYYFIISASDICEDGVMIADVCVIYVVIITYEWIEKSFFKVFIK